jgi:hypothetical protein
LRLQERRHFTQLRGDLLIFVGSLEHAPQSTLVGFKPRPPANPLLDTGQVEADQAPRCRSR